jgi:hypothetical protein
MRSIYANGDSPSIPDFTISGHRLAYLNGRRNTRQRAAIAAGLVSGEITLERPTVKQAAAICAVNRQYVMAERKRRGDPPLRQSRPKANGSNGLGAAWANATPAERNAFARELGVDQAWSVLIEPFLEAAE